MGKSNEEHQKLRRKILRALQRDCDRTNTELAHAFNIDVSTLSRIRQNLGESGYITGYKAMVDPCKAGFSTLAIVRILSRSDESQEKAGLLQRLKKHKNVVELYGLYGEHDLLAKVRFRSNSELFDFTNTLLCEKEVKGYQVDIAVCTHKETVDIPI
jgi:DNA-binding Lrp family transcriptional regulator